MNIYLDLLTSISIPNKYTKWYRNIISLSILRSNLNGYVEKHHILPRSLGGTDDKSNLAILSAREHFMCHLLLTKMLTGINKQKMWYALKFIINSTKNKNQLKIKSRYYECIRKSISDLPSPLKGRKMPASWNKGLAMSDDTKLTLSESIKQGYKNGRDLSSTVFKKGRIPHNAINKRYWFKSPNGIIYETDNITKFCRDQKLSPQAMSIIHKESSTITTHHKWTKAFIKIADIICLYHHNI